MARDRMVPRMSFLPAALVMALSAVALDATALSIRADTSAVESRNGQVVAPATQKLNVDGVPVAFSATNTSGTVVPTNGDPGTAQLVNTFSGTYTVEAEPGDSPGASACLAYEFTGNLAGSVPTTPASVAAGLGDPVGFTISANTSPASVAVPNPVVLLRTPLVGPPVVIQNFGTTSFVLEQGSTELPFATNGRFQVIAGDVVTFNFVMAVAVRAEPTTGVASGASAVRWSIEECRQVAVPGLSGLGTALLALLLGAITFGRMRARRGAA